MFAAAKKNRNPTERASEAETRLPKFDSFFVIYKRKKAVALKPLLPIFPNADRGE